MTVYMAVASGLWASGLAWGLIGGLLGLMVGIVVGIGVDGAGVGRPVWAVGGETR